MFRFAMQKSDRSAFANEPTTTVADGLALGLGLQLLIIVGLGLGLISPGCGPPA
jgi:hypothetical protein